MAPFVESGKLRSVLFEGLFEARHEGIYTFCYADKTDLEVHMGSELVSFDNDGHWSILLKKGLHRMSLRMTTLWMARQTIAHGHVQGTGSPGRYSQ